MPTYIPDRIYIYESELCAISQQVVQFPDKETGGDCFGLWTHQGCPVVQRVIGPGENARADRTSFYQDVAFLSEEGLRLQQAHGLQHIGQWHSHHCLGLSLPSNHDDRTIYSAMSKYGLSRFCLLIATLDELFVPALHSFLYREPDLRNGLHWTVLAGNSPFSCRTEERAKLPLCCPPEHKRTPEELASVSDLLSGSDGRTWLQQVYDSLSLQCDTVVMQQNQFKQIVFVCSKDDKRSNLVIPSHFPDEPYYWVDPNAHFCDIKIPPHG
ncbi:MAG: hypothetical protein JW739_02530 [Opitutales bacterium]|nr:hypothetical protein [Opitutales bacterium]